MINFLNCKKGLIITFLLSVAFLLLFYGEVFLNPNEYIFSPSGDGIKNYFTYIYHIKNDTSVHFFNGMAYPFGDLHIFSDGHTLLSSFLQFIPNSEKWAIGFLNLLLLSSFPITSCIVYKLLSSFNVRTFVAVVFSITIMLMAPQYTRLFGHFSMAYSFFIPLTWYWVRQYNLYESKKHTIYIFVLQLILYFTHPYLGVISLIFLLTHQGLKFFIDKSKRVLTFALHTIVQSLLPLFLFQSYVTILDTISDRASYKFNFGASSLDFKGVFFPHRKPFLSIFKGIFNFDDVKWESLCYIGIVNILFLLLIFYRFISKKRKWLRIKKSWIIVVGALGLIYASGLPFKYGMGILDIFPQIRQIRVLSRFAWIFYFTASVFVAIYFNKIYVNYLWTNKKAIAFLFVGLIFTINSWESYSYHSTSSEKMTLCKNPFIENNLSLNQQNEIQSLKHSEYQALLALPYFQVGGERSIHNIKDYDLFYEALVLSYHTKIPLINTCLSRSSSQNLGELSKSLKENYTEQQLRKTFIKDGRKVAVIKGIKNLNNIEKRTLSFCNKVSFSKRIFDFDYKNAMKNYKDSVLGFYKKNYLKFHHQGKLNFEDSSKQVIFEDFDNSGNNDEIVFRGDRAQKSYYNQFTTIIDLKNQLKNKKYDVSFWYYSDMDTTNHIMCFVNEQKEGKPSKWSNVTDTKINYKHYGKWSLVEFSIQPIYPQGTQKIMLKGNNTYFNPPIFFDQILIKQENTDVYMNYNGELFKNNYPVGTL